YSNLLKVDPKFVQAHVILGAIYEQQKEVEKAKYHYQEALKVDPNLAVAANNLAWILAESNGNIDQALSLAQIAKQKLPEVPNISDTLGWIYYKKNVFALAIAQFKDAIEKDANNPVYRYHLGMAYYKSGQKEESKASLSKAVGMKKEFVGSEEAKKVL